MRRPRSLACSRNGGSGLPVAAVGAIAASLTDEHEHDSTQEACCPSPLAAPTEEHNCLFGADEKSDAGQKEKLNEEAQSRAEQRRAAGAAVADRPDPMRAERCARQPLARCKTHLAEPATRAVGMVAVPLRLSASASAHVSERQQRLVEQQNHAQHEEQRAESCQTSTDF